MLSHLRRYSKNIFLVACFLAAVFLMTLQIDYIKTQLWFKEKVDESPNLKSEKKVETKLKTASKPTEDFSAFYTCQERDSERRYIHHGQYWLMKNLLKASKTFKCLESITYTTHGDFTFLDNLIPLLKRWKAPVSIAVWAPGELFNTSLTAMLYLRNCLPDSPIVKQLVTFHVFFEADLMPPSMPFDIDEFESQFQCSGNEPIYKETLVTQFKNASDLTYPINVGRNLARSTALTHFVLPSDIELYPNPGLVAGFLNMVRKEPKKHLTGKRVFPIPIFEVPEDQEVPNTKAELIDLMQKNRAFWFHYHICKHCHLVPKRQKWLQMNETEMTVSATTKRRGSFMYWEPIYIGTLSEPLYEERLNWEGKSDKMTQGYIMCLLDYDFNVLSNAFLVHRPGIKKLLDAVRPNFEAENQALKKNIILNEMNFLYGKKDGCRL